MTDKKAIAISVLLLILLSSLNNFQLEQFDSIELKDESKLDIRKSSSVSSNTSMGWSDADYFGSENEDFILDMSVSSSGNIFILGINGGDFNINENCETQINGTSLTDFTIYVAKFDSNRTCLWTLGIYYSDATDVYISNMAENHNQYVPSRGNIVVDDNENVFISSILRSDTGGLATIDFNENGSVSLSHSGQSSKMNFIAKISNLGTWEWVEKFNTQYTTALALGNSGDVWVSSGYPSSYIYRYNETGILQSSTHITNMQVFDMDTNSQGELYFSGVFQNQVSMTVNGSLQSFTATVGYDGVIGKLDSSGNGLWLSVVSNSSSTSYFSKIAINEEDEIFAVGSFYAGIEIGSDGFSTGGTRNAFLTKISSTGQWEQSKQFACSCSVSTTDLEFDSDGNMYALGYLTSGAAISFGNGITQFSTGADADGFVVKFDSSGLAKWSKSFGGLSNDIPMAMSLTEHEILIAGYYSSGAVTFGDYSIANNGAVDGFLTSLSVDSDGDEVPDIDDIDDDGDLIIDVLDECQISLQVFVSTVNLDYDSDGCHDEIEDMDDDNDNYEDANDSCPKGMIGWVASPTSDYDSDGCMDAFEDYDDDSDGFEDFLDYCPRLAGNSTMIYEKGCPDSDGDGRADILDPFKNDSTEWIDSDGDGVGDNSDVFPIDATQQFDFDGDGYGDEEFGNGGDSCPLTAGNSTIDRRGCLDSDGDGWSDIRDDFPFDSSEHLDTDGDGYSDSSEQFPFDPTQWSDADGDGMGDNPMGIGADKFPNDATQWSDIDGDGFGDNPNGTTPDSFITDSTQWSDQDGDGYGDNPAGRLYDQFPSNPTQWADQDGDGLGDNINGTQADPYLNDFDNDGYNDSVDILPKLASAGDLDNDGCPDEFDAFPSDYTECSDFDGDGEGDNADTDDDNDGWSDTAEIRLGTNPMKFSDEPVDSFEIVIPGTSVGLGAWDLIGIFGGIPLFCWIGFGFITRNARCSRFEELLIAATTREELEEIALQWEFSLMLRMLGPHQGIRLERIRSELDDELENAMNYDLRETQSQDNMEKTQSIQVKDIPEILSPPSTDIIGKKDGQGYEWTTDETGFNWYRIQNSNSPWEQFIEE